MSGYADLHEDIESVYSEECTRCIAFNVSRWCMRSLYEFVEYLKTNKAMRNDCSMMYVKAMYDYIVGVVCSDDVVRQRITSAFQLCRCSRNELASESADLYNIITQPTNITPTYQSACGDAWLCDVMDAVSVMYENSAEYFTRASMYRQPWVLHTYN